MTLPTAVAAAACAIALAAPLGAQLPNASAQAFGMGDNFTAAARGADAAAWNPANLGLRGNPGFSLRGLSAGGVSGIDPISWSDVAAYGDRTVPRDVRLSWLDAVTAAGSQSGTADGGVTVLALSAGRVGVHVGAAGYASASMSPDAVEALFFGNAGRTGQPRDLHFGGSSVRGGAFGTAAMSVAQPIGDRLSLGVTGKYVRGAGVLRAEDGGSSVTASDLAVRFPVVVSQGTNAGAGFGLDLGLAWQSQRLSLGARVENVVNTFAWDASQMTYRAGTASFDGTNSSSDFDERPYAEAPQALRDGIAAEKFAPTIGGGLAFRQSAKLLVTADARQQLGGDDAIVIGPKTHVGVGIESSALHALPLRAGAAYVTGGWQVAGGAGVRLGAVELAGAVTLRQQTQGRAKGIMINVMNLR